MPVFRYQAISRSGETLTGEREAETTRDVAAFLQAQGHFPVAVKSLQRGGRLKLPELRFEGSGTRREVALFTYELAVLLQAGFPVDRALASVAASLSDKRLRVALKQVTEDVRGGGSLAEALRRYPKLFPQLYCALVEAGEASGALAETLLRLAEDLGKAEQFREAVSSALLYPAMLIVLSVVSIIFILLIVVPSFRPMLVDAGVELPSSMSLLLAASNGLEQWGGSLALLAAIGLAVLISAWRKPRFQIWRDAKLLQLPGLRDVIAKADTARLCRSLGLLLNNGAPLTMAWRTVKAGVKNTAFQVRIADIGDAIAEGDSLAAALERSGVVSSLAVHMIRVGEQTGKLGAMADQAAALIERDVKRRLDRFLAVLVPALTIGVGAMIAFLVATVFSALLSINQIVL